MKPNCLASRWGNPEGQPRSRTLCCSYICSIFCPILLPSLPNKHSSRTSPSQDLFPREVDLRQLEIYQPVNKLRQYGTEHGWPTPGGHGLVQVCGLLEAGPHSRRWAAGEQAKLHLYLQLLPITCITAWAPPPVRSVAAVDSHWSTNPPVNCTGKGSSLRVPYENLMPDELILHYGELYNYFMIYHNVTTIEIKYTINVMCLSHPETTLPPGPKEKVSPTNQLHGVKQVGEPLVYNNDKRENSVWRKPLIPW